MKADYKTLQKKMEEQQLTLKDGNFYDEDDNIVSKKMVCKLFKCIDSELELAILDSIKQTELKNKNSLQGPFDNTELEDVFTMILEKEELYLDTQKSKYYTKDEETGRRDYISDQDFNFRLTFRINEYKLTTPTKITEKMMEQFAIMKAINLLRDNIKTIRNSIKYNKEHKDFADIYLTKMHDIFDFSQDVEIFKMLMKHFIWQIKRKSSSQKTYYDIMIAIFGAQGIGKSFVMNSIFGTVLGELYSASEDLETILEKNNARLLIDQFLINIEELAKTGDALNTETGARFKKLMTDENVTYRPFFTQKIASEPIRASFISTANKHIYTLIKDPTGMRRFFEFTSQLDPNNVISDANTKWLKDNALKLFQSIDETKDKGYWEIDSELGKEITKIQNTYSYNATEDWLKNNYTKDIKLTYSNSMNLTKIYESYLTYYSSLQQDSKYKKSKEGLLASIETTFGIKKLDVHSGGNVRYRLTEITTTHTQSKEQPKSKIDELTDENEEEFKLPQRSTVGKSLREGWKG